jgi:cytochrome P450
MTIFLAGHETVANALTWTFYLLSQNPKQEKILHEEVDSALDDDNNDRTVPNVKDISKLEYTQRVFEESMRLYPPAWAIGRQAIEDCKIGDYVVPAGSSIIMSQYLMHHNPLYFPEPERFDPVLIIATIARRWKMRIMPGYPIVLQPLVTLRPKYGMQMSLIDRNNVGHI